MTARTLLARTLLALALVVLVGSCGGGSPASPGKAAGSATATGSPRPARTIVRNTHVYRAGDTARLRAQRGVVLRLTVSRPRVSRTRLSSTHGYPPRHGYYVTFRVTVVNAGRRPVQIGPQDFVVRGGGAGAVTVYDGNAPFSGAPRQLDTTGLGPGERVSAPLTFDVATTHGRVAFVPDRSAAAAWTF